MEGQVGKAEWEDCGLRCVAGEEEDCGDRRDGQADHRAEREEYARYEATAAWSWQAGEAKGQPRCDEVEEEAEWALGDEGEGHLTVIPAAGVSDPTVGEKGLRRTGSTRHKAVARGAIPHPATMEQWRGWGTRRV